jgi:hypothetical protein
MIPVYSSWLAAHGKLWYDDKWYWPQALAAALVLLFWAMPSTVTAFGHGACKVVTMSGQECVSLGPTVGDTGGSLILLAA